MARTPEERQDHEELSRHLADVVRANDPTRPVTCGCNGPDKDNCVYTSGALDVIGLNYRAYAYDSLRVWFPWKPILGTETVSAQNSRGIYYQPSTILRVPGWMPWSGTPEPTEEELKGLIRQFPRPLGLHHHARRQLDSHPRPGLGRRRFHLDRF